MTDSGDDDVVLLRDRARVQRRGLRDEVTGNGVGIPRGRRDYALAIVGYDVEAEPKAGAARDLAHRLVERVAFDLREAHTGVFEETHAVRRRDRRLAGAADRHGLAAPGISSVPVWLDDPGRDDELGLLDELLGRTRHVAGRDRAEVRSQRAAASIRVDGTHAGH